MDVEFTILFCLAETPNPSVIIEEECSMISAPLSNNATRSTSVSQSDYHEDYKYQCNNDLDTLTGKDNVILISNKANLFDILID